MPEIDASREKFNFTSSGLSEEEDLQRVGPNQSLEEDIFERPYGFAFPLQINESGHGFKIHTNPLNAIADNLHHLLLTNHGERLGNFYFGANLQPLLMEGVSIPDLQGAVAARISNAVDRFMPYVELQDLALNFIPTNESSTQKVEMRITYTVPKISPDIRGKIITMNLGA